MVVNNASADKARINFYNYQNIKNYVGRKQYIRKGRVNDIAFIWDGGYANCRIVTFSIKGKYLNCEGNWTDVAECEAHLGEDYYCGGTFTDLYIVYALDEHGYVKGEEYITNTEHLEECINSVKRYTNSNEVYVNDANYCANGYLVQGEYKGRF